MISLLRAFIMRDYAIERSYRFHLLMKAADILFQLGLFFFLSRLVSIQDYFPFVLVGLMFSRFFGFWINVFTQNIRQEQYWGTAELLFLSPHGPLGILLASAAGKLALLLLELAVYVLLGRFLFGVTFSSGTLLAVPLLFINSIAFAGIGLFAGSFILYFKRGDPANWLVTSSFDLLSGVYFPLSVLPSSLQTLAWFLPTTSALALWRASFLSQSVPSFSQLAVQGAWALALGAAGLFALQLSVTLARKKGDLGSY